MFVKLVLLHFTALLSPRHYYRLYKKHKNQAYNKTISIIWG